MSFAPPPSSNPSVNHNDDIDLRNIFSLLGRGAGQIIGLAMLGLVVGVTGYFVVSPRLPILTSTRVSFAFHGFDRGEYPDHSKFQPDDLRSPEIIAEALRRQGLDTSEFQAQIRGALSIEGFISPNIIKERDRLRAGGQTLPPYVPDEYSITLSLPRRFPLNPRQREQILNEIVNVYRENFRRTYAEPPLAFGNAFATLRKADVFDYEVILNNEIESVEEYLTQQSYNTEAKSAAGETVTASSGAMRSFRSRSTNLSFSDLLKQVELFSKIRLNETLGLIRQNGLSQDRATALAKMNYYLQNLEDQAQEAVAEEKTVRELLAQTQNRAQSYVLGIKTQADQPRSEVPLIDQGLMDSLLANDSYNFLVHRALEAGLKTKRILAERDRTLERRKSLESVIQQNPSDQSAITAQVQKSLTDLEAAYQTLVASIRKTEADYAQQEFGDAIRLSDDITTEGMTRLLSLAGIFGALLGAITGMGLSLLGIYIGSAKRLDANARIP